jgi:hypothetical protein
VTLDPTPPFVTRQRLRLRTQRRNLRYWTARQLRRLAHRLDPLPRGADRHPSVVEHGYAQGRADLQLVHRLSGHAPRPDRKADAEEFWRRVDAERPELRAVVEADLRRRAEQIRDRARRGGIDR